MATVGITKELIDRVRNKISSMRRGEIATDLPEFERGSSIDAQRIVTECVWSEKHMHLATLIPPEWMTKIASADIKITGSAMFEDGDRTCGYEHETSIRFEGLTNCFARPADGYWNRSAGSITIDAIKSMPEDTPGRAECIKRWEDSLTARDITARWNKIDSDIFEFLRKCKSLNEAVKLFPAIKMYLHVDDIARLERKVERLSQRKKIVDDIPVDEITAAAMAAKLTGALS
jgi:hypothetical protein